MKRKNLSSKRGMGSDVFLTEMDIADARAELRKNSCKGPIENISNSDEVAVLYRCLPGRAIHDPVVGSSFIRV